MSEPTRIPSLVVGVLGHFQHGKTTLSAALTRVLAKIPGASAKVLSVDELHRSASLFNARDGWYDERPERPRGWSFWGCTSRHVSLWYQTERTRYAHLDCPGHFGRLKNVIIGAAQLDVAIIVVSARESVAAQTREHLYIAKNLGVTRFVAFINQCDLIDDPEWLDLVEFDIREAFTALGLSGDSLTVVRGAALPAYEGDPTWTPTMLALIEAIEHEHPAPQRRTEGAPILWAERAYMIYGRGVVVAGKLSQGQLQEGQAVELLGFGAAPRESVILSLRSFQEPRKSAQAGDYVGVLLKGTRRDEARRGQALSTPGALQATQIFRCQLSLLTTKDGGRHTPLCDGHRAQLYFGVASTTGTLRLSDAIAPGESTVNVEVRLLYPLYLEVGQRFVVGDGSDGLRQQRPSSQRQWGGLIGAGTITALDV